MDKALRSAVANAKVKSQDEGQVNSWTSTSCTSSQAFVERGPGA
jgi:hypothetical protein